MSHRLVSNFIGALRCGPSHLGKGLSRMASTYEGDGKTNAKVLNQDTSYLMVNAIGVTGFALNTGIRLIGPSVLFPRTFLSWNIAGVSDISEKSLALFTVLDPKVDIIVLGYGDAKALPKTTLLIVEEFAKKYKIGFEILPTEKAVATFNFLNSENRYVVGLFIPPTQVTIHDDLDFANARTRQRLLDLD